MPDSLVVESLLRGEDGLFELHATTSFTPESLAQLHLIRDASGVASILAVQADAVRHAAGDGIGGFDDPTVLEFRNPTPVRDIFVGQFDDGPAEDFAPNFHGTLEYAADASSPENRSVPNNAIFAIADFSGNGIDDLVTVVATTNSSGFDLHAELSVSSQTVPPFARVSHGGHGILGIATQDVDADGTNDLIALADGLEGTLVVVRNLADPEEICVDLHVLDAPYSGLRGPQPAEDDGLVVLVSDTQLLRIEPG